MSPLGVSISVATEVAAPLEAVWAELEAIERHVGWMADAVAIRFLSEQRRGVGTEFWCDTKVGPLRLTDRMVITDWVDRRSVAVAHVGLVTGEGRLALSPVSGSVTKLSWDERLAFPWWLGGAIGGLAARPILSRLWRHNLASLRRIVEAQVAPPAGRLGATDTP